MDVPAREARRRVWTVRPGLNTVVKTIVCVRQAPAKQTARPMRVSSAACTMGVRCGQGVTFAAAGVAVACDAGNGVSIDRVKGRPHVVVAAFVGL